MINIVSRDLAARQESLLAEAPVPADWSPALLPLEELQPAEIPCHVSDRSFISSGLRRIPLQSKQAVYKRTGERLQPVPVSSEALRVERHEYHEELDDAGTIAHMNKLIKKYTTDRQQLLAQMAS